MKAFLPMQGRKTLGWRASDGSKECRLQMGGRTTSRKALFADFPGLAVLWPKRIRSLRWALIALPLK